MTVNEKMTAIADAIREKTGGSDSLTLDQMAHEIASIEVGIDTSDATATADDIVSGATAYVNGEKITGTIRRAHGGFSTYEAKPSAAGGGAPFVHMRAEITEPTLISPNTGGTVNMYASFEDFGDATAEDVAKGKTFTSAAGFKAVGTMEANEVVYTPLAYLEGDGSQWIDTGISGGINAAYELMFQHTADEYGIQSYDYLFAGAKSGYIPFITYYTWNGFHANVDGGAYGTTFSYKKDAKDITAGLRYNSDGIVQSKWGSNDWEQQTIEQGSASAVAGKGWGNKNWYIFNCPEEANIITMRLYYLKMYTDGELVRDFVPVRKESNGECGLYDNVSGKFFGNSGTGAFSGMTENEYALSILGVRA